MSRALGGALSLTFILPIASLWHLCVCLRFMESYLIFHVSPSLDEENLTRQGSRSGERRGHVPVPVSKAALRSWHHDSLAFAC